MLKLIYFKRAFLWIVALIYTLAKFWLKNPKESPAVLSFFIEKIIASPRFFSRILFTEKYSQEFESILIKTVNLYKKYGTKFDPKDQNSYKKLKKNLPIRAQILYFLTRKLRPKTVVETGVAAGESTGFILQALFDNNKGRLYSIDLPFQWYIYGKHNLHLDSLPAGKMPGFLVPSKLKKNWKLIMGNTYNELPELLKKIKEIDIFIHDSEHTYKTMLYEYKTSWPYLRDGGALVSDDVSYTKAFNSFSKEKKVKKIIFKDIGILLKD